MSLDYYYYYMQYKNYIFSPSLSLSLSLSLPHTFQSFQIINITVCDTAKHRAIYQGVLSGYIFITFILIFILVLLTANVPLSSFRREQRATYRVIIVALLPSSLLTIAQTFLLISEPTLFSTYVFLALEVCWTLLLIILLLLVLVPAVS